MRARLTARNRISATTMRDVDSTAHPLQRSVSPASLRRSQLSAFGMQHRLSTLSISDTLSSLNPAAGGTSCQHDAVRQLQINQSEWSSSMTECQEVTSSIPDGSSNYYYFNILFCICILIFLSGGLNLRCVKNYKKRYKLLLWPVVINENQHAEQQN